MRYFRLTNKILEAFKDRKGNIVGVKCDEPEWAKQAGWTALTAIYSESDKVVYTYVAYDETKITVVIQDPSAVKEISRAELDQVYTAHFPTLYIHPETFEQYREAEIANLPRSERARLIKQETKDQVNIDEEILSKVSGKTRSSFGTNWSGTVSGGTMANADVVVGNLTNNSGSTLSVTAGATIYFSGNYSITNNGTFTAAGTSVSNIAFKSNLAAPLNNSWGGILFNTDYIGTLQYCQFYHASLAVRGNGSAMVTSTFDHLYFQDCGTALRNNGATFSNVKIYNCTNGCGGTSNTIITTLVDTEICNVANNGFGATNSLVGTRLRINSAGSNPITINSTCTQTLNNCLIDGVGGSVIDVAGHASTMDNWNNSVLHCSEDGGIGYVVRLQTTSRIRVSGCDLYGYGGANNEPLTGVAANIGFQNCLIAGFNNYGLDTADTTNGGSDDSTYDTTGLQFSVVNYVSGAKTFALRNETFTPSGVTVSSITDTGWTMNWTSGSGIIGTKHRVQLGTVSGTWTEVITKDYDWSNWDNLKTIVTTTPSFAIVNKKAATTYYAKPQSWDWIFDKWIDGIVQSIATTSSYPAITNATISTNTPDTSQSITVTANISNTPTSPPIVTIKKSATDTKMFPMFLTAGTTYQAIIKCLGTPSADNTLSVNGIGTCTNASVYIDASNASGGASQVTVSTTLTVAAGNPCIG